MKSGKLSEAVLKRSVFKEITSKRKDVIIGAGICRNSAAVKIPKEDLVLLSTNPISINTDNIEGPYLYRVLNNIAASGGKTTGVLLNFLFPEFFEETDIRKLMKIFNEECKELGLQIIGGHSELSDSVNKAICTITALGHIKENELLNIKKAKPGHQIVMSKHAGAKKEH